MYMEEDTDGTGSWHLRGRGNKAVTSPFHSHPVRVHNGAQNFVRKSTKAGDGAISTPVGTEEESSSKHEIVKDTPENDDIFSTLTDAYQCEECSRIIAGIFGETNITEDLVLKSQATLIQTDLPGTNDGANLILNDRVERAIFDRCLTENCNFSDDCHEHDTSITKDNFRSILCHEAVLSEDIITAENDHKDTHKLNEFSEEKLVANMRYNNICDIEKSPTGCNIEADATAKQIDNDSIDGYWTNVYNAVPEKTSVVTTSQAIDENTLRIYKCLKNRSPVQVLDKRTKHIIHTPEELHRILFGNPYEDDFAKSIALEDGKKEVKTDAKLGQKIEHIEEMPVVDAGKSKAGLNTQPILLNNLHKTVHVCKGDKLDEIAVVPIKEDLKKRASKDSEMEASENAVDVNITDELDINSSTLQATQLQPNSANENPKIDTSQDTPSAASPVVYKPKSAETNKKREPLLETDEPGSKSGKLKEISDNEAKVKEQSKEDRLSVLLSKAPTSSAAKDTAKVESITKDADTFPEWISLKYPPVELNFKDTVDECNEISAEDTPIKSEQTIQATEPPKEQIIEKPKHMPDILSKHKTSQHILQSCIISKEPVLPDDQNQRAKNNKSVLLKEDTLSDENETPNYAPAEGPYSNVPNYHQVSPLNHQQPKPIVQWENTTMNVLPHLTEDHKNMNPVTPNFANEPVNAETHKIQEYYNTFYPQHAPFYSNVLATSQHLKNTTNKIYSTTDKLQNTTDKLEATTKELLTTSEELQTASQKLQATNETLAASNLKDMIQENMQRIDNSLQTANDKIQMTSEKIQSTCDKIQVIYDKIQSAGHKLNTGSSVSWNTNQNLQHDFVDKLQTGPNVNLNSKPMKNPAGISEIKLYGKKGAINKKARYSKKRKHAKEESEEVIKDSETPITRDDKGMKKETIAPQSPTLSTPVAAANTIPVLKPLPKLNDNIKLSELMQLVRERNRLLNCPELIKTEVVESKKSVPPLSQPMHNTKVYKSPGYPELKPSPKICAPVKKKSEPKKTNCTRCDLKTLGFDDFLGPRYGAPNFPGIAGNARDPQSVTITSDVPNTADLTEEIILQLQRIGDVLKAAYERSKLQTLEAVMLSKTWRSRKFNRIKDFEPWNPIPSWPQIKKHERPKLQCPKEGCPYPPPINQDQPPCQLRPCKTFPTFPKRIFSLEFITVCVDDHIPFA